MTPAEPELADGAETELDDPELELELDDPEPEPVLLLPESELPESSEPAEAPEFEDEPALDVPDEVPAALLGPA